MIIRLLSRNNQTQPGFTLIEVLVALIITAIIVLGASMATVQVLRQGCRNNNYTTASRQAMNAIFWISRDVQMAQAITTNGEAGFPLSLIWTEWDNSEHQVSYSIVDNQLMRSYSVSSAEPILTLVAEYINSNSENTSCEINDRVFILKVTATVGDGTGIVSVARNREIIPRPDL